MPYKNGRNLFSNLLFKRQELPVNGRSPAACQVVKGSAVPIFPGRDDRIGKNQSRRAYIFLTKARLHQKKIAFPENSQGCRQMPACRKTAQKNPLRIDMPLLRISAYQRYGSGQLTEGLRENAGRRTVMKYKCLAVHRQKLKCRRLPFTGGTKLITASRADNDCFPACIRLSVRIIFQKAG